MSTFAITREPLATHIEISDSALRIFLADGREVSAPLAWFPRLLAGSPDARANWRFIGGGIGVHWPELEEDVSVDSLLLAR